MTSFFSMPFLLESIVPYTVLINAALVFAFVVVGILLFILLYLFRHSRQQKRKVHLQQLFSDLIAGIVICESEEECNDTLQPFLTQHQRMVKKPLVRKILIKEIVRTKDSISGQAAENLRWLYETLTLDRDTLQRFSGTQWYRKASAIQHLAEMQQNKYLQKIYRETNNPNTYIRTEAQVAVVKLTGFKGLRFLNIVSYPVSQWQQLSLISQLQEGEIELDKINRWLQSKNETVVEFALRLVEIYKCYELHDVVLQSLRHCSATVRLQALQAVREIYTEATPALLVQHFDGAGREEQLRILDMLLDIEAGSSEVGFLTSLLQHPDEAIRFRAMRGIQQLSPAWSARVIRQVKDLPSFTYILSSLTKQAV